MKIKIIERGLKVNDVFINKISDKVLHINIDTVEKWPEICTGSNGYDPESKTHFISSAMVMFYTNEINEGSAEVHFIPEEDWEKEVFMACQSKRYGWTGIIYGEDLLKDI